MAIDKIAYTLADIMQRVLVESDSELLRVAHGIKSAQTLDQLQWTARYPGVIVTMNDGAQYRIEVRREK